MRLRKPCEHGLYDQHVIPTGIYGHGPSTCPGGEFLADDALVIEKVDGEWPKWALGRLRPWALNPDFLLDGLTEPLTVREGAG